MITTYRTMYSDFLYEQHLVRLQNVKSHIDNKPNKRMKEVIAFKNKMVIHKRNMEIQKLVCENILLYDRLKSIKPSIKF